MKPLLTLLTLFSLTISFAQSNSINYKALIKDGGGSVVANQSVDIQFIIYEGAGETTNVYQETHTVNTDANGIAIVNIGQGTTSDVFADINWGADDHYLNVQIDTGGGLTDMGTTGFNTVPYALNAANVEGLEKITENGNTGWRLVGRDPDDYGDIGNDAIDLSRVGSASIIQRGAIGNFSIAMGSNTTASGLASIATGTTTYASGDRSTAMGLASHASGEGSTAMGNFTKASGNFSTAMGDGTTASGIRSLATGNNTRASGDNAFSVGWNTKAKANNSVAMGRYNVGGGTPGSWVETDPLFEIGNGIDDANRSNTLTVLKNGIITADSFDTSEIDTAGDKALITKEYADNNYNPTGLEQITENGVTGWRLVGSDPAEFGDIGEQAVDLSIDSLSTTTGGAIGKISFATGHQTIASGNFSTAMGNQTTASGIRSTATGNFTTASALNSIAMGNQTTASGESSTAMGSNTTASGLRSLATGNGTIASGNNAFSVGVNTKAEASNSIATGRFNIGGGTSGSWVETDPLFEIGNGTADDARSNALTVLKNGTIIAPTMSASEIDVTGNPTLITKEYADTNYNPTGLEQITENSNTGYRIIDRNPINYGDIGTNAIDLSNNDTASTTRGATGSQSFAAGRANTASGFISSALGWFTTASGSASTTLGQSTIASGDSSIAMGNGATASGDSSTAMGLGTIASGESSTAMGKNTNAEANSSIATGRYNVGGGTPDTWIETDPLFEIGNGESHANRSNALTVLKNGTISAPSMDSSEIDAAGDKALITKEYADSNYNPTGLEETTESGNTGWRIIGRTIENFGDIGDNAVDISTGFDASTTRGATGNYAFAAGRITTASGQVSTAFGQSTIASGSFSTAMGNGATASGLRSIATGNGTIASGNNAFSVGWDTKAEANNSVAMGRYNIGGGSPGTWIGTDPLFEIGNGDNDASRSNAFTVLKNGNATLAGTLTENSDRRLKTEITSLDYGLNEILQLNPVSYYWKKDRNSQDQKSIGLIAQDVQLLLKELVRTAQDKDQTLSVNYSGLIPVLIKALQEQQKQIETLKKDNQLKENKNKTLEARLDKVEQLISQMSN